MFRTQFSKFLETRDSISNLHFSQKVDNWKNPRLNRRTRLKGRKTILYLIHSLLFQAKKWILLSWAHSAQWILLSYVSFSLKYSIILPNHWNIFCWTWFFSRLHSDFQIQASVPKNWNIFLSKLSFSKLYLDFQKSNNSSGELNYFMSKLFFLKVLFRFSNLSM